MSSESSPARIVVRRPMNDHGTMTVERCSTNDIRHICEYATPDLRRRLALLSDGTELLLSMSLIGGRSNIWRATAIVEERPTPTDRDPDGPTTVPPQPARGRPQRP